MGLFRLGLRARIYGGFAFVVVVGGALALFATVELASIKSEVGKMTALSDNTTRALEISRLFEIMRRSALQYKQNGEDELLKDGSQAAARAVDELRAAAQATLSEQKRNTYNGLVDSVATYQKKRDALIAVTKATKDNQVKLFTGGDQLTESSDKLVKASRADGDGSLSSSADAIEVALLKLRVANWRFQATHDSDGTATFKAASEGVHNAITAFEKNQMPEDTKALIGPVRDSLHSYVSNFDGYAANLIKSNDLFANEMVPEIVEMQKSIGAAEESLRQDFARSRTSADETIVSTSTTQQIMAALALLGGALIAYLIGRSVIRPVAGMTSVMQKLATGDTSVDVPSRDGTDEIGSMARAVEVFKENAIERIRLETEQKEVEGRAAASRKADMHRLADSFQLAVGNVVDNVTSAATELEAAAGTLTQTAESTQQLSEIVAGASEEASSNVQSVASATEELSASVNEIARQVHESTKIAGEAVAQATKTDERIKELSQAAQRIGDVVKLITAIAEQTNLLALNATIEAARAGESGRGFAVVAQEVKTLAAQTAKATDEIGSQIASMQTATEESVNAIKEIGATIECISNIAATIAAAVEEQGASTQEIARNVQEAARGTSKVAANIGDVNKGAGETGSASTQVLSSARSLANDGNRLKIEVEKFLATVRAA